MVELATLRLPSGPIAHGPPAPQRSTGQEHTQLPPLPSAQRMASARPNVRSSVGTTGAGAPAAVSGMTGAGEPAAISGRSGTADRAASSAHAPNVAQIQMIARTRSIRSVAQLGKLRGINRQ